VLTDLRTYSVFESHQQLHFLNDQAKHFLFIKVIQHPAKTQDAVVLPLTPYLGFVTREELSALLLQRLINITQVWVTTSRWGAARKLGVSIEVLGRQFSSAVRKHSSSPCTCAGLRKNASKSVVGFS